MTEPRGITKAEVVFDLIIATVMAVGFATVQFQANSTPEGSGVGETAFVMVTTAVVIAFLSALPVVAPYTALMCAVGLPVTALAYWIEPAAVRLPSLMGTWAVQIVLCGLAALVVKFLVSRTRRTDR